MPQTPTTAEWLQGLASTARMARELRKTLGWSQQELGSRAHLSQGAVSRFEAGPTEDLPLWTALRLLSTLAAGIRAADLPIAHGAQSLLDCAAVFLEPVALTPSLDPELVQLIRAFHRLPKERRGPVLRLVAAANDLFGREWGHHEGQVGAAG